MPLRYFSGKSRSATPSNVNVDLGSNPVYSKTVKITDTNVTSTSKILPWHNRNLTPGIPNLICSATPNPGFFDLSITSTGTAISGIILIYYLVI